jgi:hypothetical protein
LLEIGSNLKGDDWYCWRLIILTKKLNVKEILAVHKRVGNKIASTVIGATFRTGGITVSQAFAIARSSGEESQHCYSTLARVLTETNRWADISIRQALEIGRRSWGEWLLVGEHIDWSQLNAEQVIEIGRACSKPHIWEKVAQYMEWSTLGTERVLDVCIEANHTAVWIAATKYLTSASMSE